MESSEIFYHPGNKTFDDCERTFKTSYYADGDILFYTNKNGNSDMISGYKSKEKLEEVCSACPKYEGCLVNEILLKTLAYVEQRNK